MSIEGKVRNSVHLLATGVCTAALIGCSGSSGGSAPPEPVAEVQASAWVSSSSDVAGYDVGVLADGSVELKMQGADGRSLGTVTVRQLSDSATQSAKASLNAAATLPNASPDFGDGAMEAVLKEDGVPQLTLQTKGVLEEDGYSTHMEFERPDGSTLRLRARHAFQSCYEMPAEPPPTPACAGSLKLGEAEYTLPSCGAVQLSLQDLKIATSLRELVYIKEQPRAASSKGGSVWTDGALQAATLPVYSAGELTPQADVAAWLEDVGGDAIIGSEAERRLSAVYLDPSWRRQAATKQLEAQSAVTSKACLPGLNAKAGGGCDGYGSWFADALGISSGHAVGDPHMGTFDRMAYDFQGAGEYVLAEALAGAPFTVQARFEPFNGGTPSGADAACGNVTVTTAIATRFDNTRLAIYADRDPAVWVDGNPVAEASAVAAALPAGYGFERDVLWDRYTFTWPGGERLTVRMGAAALHSAIALPPERQGEIAGLLGFFSGTADDDFRTRGGDTLSSPPAFSALYDRFGESWRIAASESLFDYGTGESTFAFTQAGFPSSPARLELLPEPVRAEAQAACAGVGSQPARSWCVLDMACTNDKVLPTLFAELPSFGKTVGLDEVEVSVIEPLQPDAVALDDVREPSGSCRLEEPLPAYAFREQDDLTLTEAVTVDATVPGTYDDETALVPASVASGQEVDVYFIHAPGSTAAKKDLGSIRFSGEILGVAVSPTALNATDATFGADGLTYPDPAASNTTGRGLSLGTDSFNIGADKKTLDLDWDAGGDVDQMRVFVSAQPTP